MLVDVDGELTSGSIVDEAANDAAARHPLVARGEVV
jgi:hypothetical protein